MYMTIKETSEYLNLPESHIKNLIHQKRIRAVFDGKQFLVYQDQFNQHLEQLEKLKQRIEEEANEPIPEDIDYKDED